MRVVDSIKREMKSGKRSNETKRKRERDKSNEFNFCVSESLTRQKKNVVQKRLNAIVAHVFIIASFILI